MVEVFKLLGPFTGTYTLKIIFTDSFGPFDLGIRGSTTGPPPVNYMKVLHLVVLPPFINPTKSEERRRRLQKQVKEKKGDEITAVPIGDAKRVSDDRRPDIPSGPLVLSPESAAFTVPR